MYLEQCLEHRKYYVGVSFQRYDYLQRFVDFPRMAPILEMHKTNPSLQRIQNPPVCTQIRRVKYSPTKQLLRCLLLFPLLFITSYMPSLSVLNIFVMFMLSTIYCFNCFIFKYSYFFSCVSIFLVFRDSNDVFKKEDELFLY